MKDWMMAQKNALTTNAATGRLCFNVLVCTSERVSSLSPALRMRSAARIRCVCGGSARSTPPEERRELSARVRATAGRISAAPFNEVNWPTTTLQKHVFSHCPFDSSSHNKLLFCLGFEVSSSDISASILIQWRHRSEEVKPLGAGKNTNLQGLLSCSLRFHISLSLSVCNGAEAKHTNTNTVWPSSIRPTSLKWKQWGKPYWPLQPIRAEGLTWRQWEWEKMCTLSCCFLFITVRPKSMRTVEVVCETAWLSDTGFIFLV